MHMINSDKRDELSVRPVPDTTQPEPTASVDDTPLPQQPALDPIAFQQGMALIRRRRKWFFATIIVYIPLMWLSSKFFPSFRGMATTFALWVLVMFITALYSALACCPRCGNYFHMHGMTLLYLRRCLHCQLSIKS